MSTCIINANAKNNEFTYVKYPNTSNSSIKNRKIYKSEVNLLINEKNK